MAKFIIVALLLWISLFAVRVFQIGGIDSNYRDEGIEYLQSLRDSLAEVYNRILPYPQSGLLAGITLGSTKSLPYFLKNDFRNTSTIHILVVSGQNLSILAGFVMSLVSILGRRKTIVLTLTLIFFYSLLTGFQVPVVRAALMVALAYLAQLLGKEGSGWWTLLLAGGIILLINPNYLLSISFQLSFLATAGVLIVAPVLVEYLKIIPQIARQDLAVTLAAQLLTLPVIAYNFSQLSLIGVLANSLIVWAIPTVMIAGFASLILGLVNTFLGQVVALIPSVLLTYIIYIVKFFAQIPGANLGVGETSMLLWIGYYLVIVGGVWMLKINTKYKAPNTKQSLNTNV